MFFVSPKRQASIFGGFPISWCLNRIRTYISASLSGVLIIKLFGDAPGGTRTPNQPGRNRPLLHLSFESKKKVFADPFGESPTYYNLLARHFELVCVFFIQLSEKYSISIIKNDLFNQEISLYLSISYICIIFFKNSFISKIESTTLLAFPSYRNPYRQAW